MTKKISLIDALIALEANLEKLSGRDWEFADSLVQQAKRRPLSDKQTPHVFRLHDKALGIVPVVETVPVDATGIEALLRAAGSRLKYPAIKLRTEDGTYLRVSIAGDRSNNPGAINIAGEGSWPDRTFFGWIKAGAYIPHHSASKATATAIGAALQAFAADPAGVAGAYGKKTGACCFCSRRLDDARSVEVGYGPTCADHYALPWG
jgi:hypothetical protein